MNFFKTLFRSFVRWRHNRQLKQGFFWVINMYVFEEKPLFTIYVIVHRNMLEFENSFDEGAMRALEFLSKRWRS